MDNVITADKFERIEAVAASLMGYAVNCGRADEMIKAGETVDEMRAFVASFVSDLCVYLIAVSPEDDITDPLSILKEGVDDYAAWMNDMFEFAGIVDNFEGGDVL